VPGKILGHMAAGLPVAAFLHTASDGHDLINLNYKGKSIQAKLNQCLEAVMMNKVENTKEALLNWVNLT
jgi:hypothetical protein